MIRQRSARFPAKLPASADGAAAAGKDPGARRGSQVPKPQCRGSKINFSVGRRKSVFPVVNKREVARSRWKQAIRKVLAFIRFQIPITSRGREDEPRMLEPTYRLEPEGDEKFRGSVARAAMERALRDRLDGYEYNRVSAPKLAKRLAALINDEMKDVGLARYKFISTVLIVENKQQDMCMASRCVWDPKFDDYVTLEVKGATFVAVACVHGVYVD